MTADPLTSEPTHRPTDASRPNTPSEDPTASAGDARRDELSTPWWPGLVARIGGNRRVGGIERQLREVVAPVLTRDELRRWIGPGSPLGHSVHPVLTDLPIGFWTSALAVDLLVGPRGARAAQRLVALGVVSTVPTALTGASDYAALPGGPARRVSVAHALTNASATALYAMSWSMRRRDHWFAGVATSVLAAGVATVGGALGGSLAFDTQLDAEGESANQGR